jgi:hypothetical protein
MSVLNNVFNLTTVLKTKIALFISMLSCIITSCATIFNRHGRFVRVYTTRPTVLIYNADTIKTQNNKAFLYVERQKIPLEFSVLTDTGAKKVVQKSTLSFAFITNFFYNYGIGALIDLTTTKRYGYPNIRLNEKDTIERHRPYVTLSKKGDFLLNVSMPMYNWFYFRPDGEPVKNIKGGPGFSMGLDYFHSQKQFLNLSAAVAIDMPDIYLDIKPYGIYEKERTRYLSLSNNHVINKFTIGYGVSYAHNSWEFVNVPNYRDTVSTTLTGRPSQTKSNNALGLVFSTYFKIVAGLNMGIIYRPTFIRFGSADKYEHLLSFDFGYRIPLNKKLFQRPVRSSASRDRKR